MKYNLRKSIVAVSYTHLDVYKRQEEGVTDDSVGDNIDSGDTSGEDYGSDSGNDSGEDSYEGEDY